eukprot:4315706-Amphidinium_carterae.1
MVVRRTVAATDTSVPDIELKAKCTQLPTDVVTTKENQNGSQQYCLTNSSGKKAINSGQMSGTTMAK